NKVIDRYIGYYAGFTGCNSGAQIIDTIFIQQYTPKDNLKVAIRQKSVPGVILVGTVSSNESTYSISIPDSTGSKYYKAFHITLQNDKSLTLYSYERDSTIAGVTSVNQCNFVGVKGK
ncbi:MAG: hypothetical protein EBZ77_12950, partial [Chitinophagia bacterium]|nr:hypothetical protein [Chitinophagia bacterium]